MGQFTAHLLDGFDHDQVVLTVDGQVRGSADEVTTSLLLGNAGTVRATLPEGKATVEIGVPTRDLAEARELDVRGDVHMLVSIEGGALSCKTADEAPGFI